MEKGVIVKKIGKKGKGVFATKFFKKNEKILDFAGELFTFDQLPESEKDGTVPSHYMQIGKNLFQGPSKSAETFVNHSCDPNCGVKIRGKKATLIAIKNVKEGEEITWDYSTTIMNDPWIMPCECGSSNCRKKIGNFDLVKKSVQRKYIKLGVVPKYILDAL